MSELVVPPFAPPEISSSPPPPSPQPVRPSLVDDARVRLHRLAAELLRTRDRRLLTEFLTLRRAVR